MTEFTEAQRQEHEDLSTLEAARLLGCSTLHIIDLLEAGVLDCHRDGADLLFAAADIATYKADKERQDADHLVGV
ncbi:helix-turn-helix domain-containing protein [Antribacter sp. KLBMP9083]|uniref:Helix-turn-helix domain-containing protein n=1 Tax=Antribacter soli TaxID=2910976 RepID=A0AA41QH08_9MICO|nr:helix-turn-helix domain-containing protein [Antribacter soli]MCF4121929.1 helix-turn-helix domain-containing protein [Antribacter soli]